MTDGMIIVGLGLIATLIAVMTPIVKLNGNIVRLTTVVEQLEELVKEKTKKLDDRVTQHGHEIDEIREKQIDHELRLKQLEK